MRVVIGEDDVLLREGIARMLEEAGLEVVAQTGNAEDFLRRALAHRPTSPSSTSRCRPPHGRRAARRDRAARTLPETGVLVLSQYFEESYAST